MKISRSLLFVVALVALGIAIVYFFAPLGIVGDKQNVAKVDDSLISRWNDIGIKSISYNLLRIDGVNIETFQENTWWSFGILVLAFSLMLPFMAAKSIGQYVFLGIFGVFVALFGSFIVGGLMIILGIVAAFDYAKYRNKKETKLELSELYREYIL